MKRILISLILAILCLNSFSQKNDNTNGEIEDVYSKTTYNNLNILDDVVDIFSFETIHKRERMEGLFVLNQDTMIVLTTYKNTDKNSNRNKKRLKAYYVINLVQKNVVEITDTRTIIRIKELILKDRQRFTRLPIKEVDSFTKETAKEKTAKAKETGRQLLQVIMSGDYIKNYAERTALYLDNINDTLIVVSLRRHHDKWENSQFYCSIQSEKKDIKSTYGVFAVGKEISPIGSVRFDNELTGCEPFANTFGEKLCISPNGEYGIYNLILFDFKLNKLYRLNNYFLGNGTSRLVVGSNSLKIVNIINRGILNVNYQIRVYKFNEAWTKLLTEETDMKAFKAEQYNNGSNKGINSDSISTSQTMQELRTGNSLDYVIIGDQTWMTENMNVGKTISGKVRQNDNSIIEKYCYDNKEENCNKYGGLYQWKEAMMYNEENRQGICPDGWHIPSIVEWNLLIEYLGGKKEAGGNMKKEEESLWKVYSDNSNSSGFSAVPAGYKSKVGNKFGKLHIATYLRTSSNTKSIYIHTNEDFAIMSGGDILAGYSVRCIKD